MSGFRDAVQDDLHGVFLNLDEFAERHTVIYDGETYEDIPVVITGLHERDRRQLQSDHAQGLYLVSRVMHCALDDLGGNQPEKGCRIRINEREGGSFFHDYYVASSICEMGMPRHGRTAPRRRPTKSSCPMCRSSTTMSPRSCTRTS